MTQPIAVLRVEVLPELLGYVRYRISNLGPQQLSTSEAATVLHDAAEQMDALENDPVTPTRERESHEARQLIDNERGAIERLTVNLTPKSQAALRRSADTTGDTLTDSLNRALQYYDAFLSGRLRGDH